MSPNSMHDLRDALPSTPGATGGAPSRRPLPKPPGAGAGSSAGPAGPGSGPGPGRTLPSLPSGPVSTPSPTPTPRIPSGAPPTHAQMLSASGRPLPGLPNSPYPSSTSHSHSITDAPHSPTVTPPTSHSHGLGASTQSQKHEPGYGYGAESVLGSSTGHGHGHGHGGYDDRQLQGQMYEPRDGRFVTTPTPTPPPARHSIPEASVNAGSGSGPGRDAYGVEYDTPSATSSSSHLPPLLPGVHVEPLFPEPRPYRSSDEAGSSRAPAPAPGTRGEMYGADGTHPYPHPPGHGQGQGHGQGPQHRRSVDSTGSFAAAHSAWVERKLQIHQSQEEDEWEEQEVEEIHFFQPALLSEAAVQLRDRVERRRHLKGGIAWTGSFTGKDIVTTIQSFLPAYTRESPADRRFALLMAQSLQNQLWFVEVDWDIKPLRDSSEDVFRFMEEGMAGDALTGELPKGLMTMATRCYSPSCSDGCYAPRCPFRTPPATFLTKPIVASASQSSVQPRKEAGEGWAEELDPRLLRDLSPQQVNRQNIIRQAIQAEVQYEADLTATYNIMLGLREANVIPFWRLETFINDVFGNVLELREACRRVIDHFSIRQREQAPLIRTVGDIFLEAATEFRLIYPEYTGNMPAAEEAIRKELENPEFRLFTERVARNDRRRDIKYLIARPANQLQRYPAVLEAILNATEPGDPDLDFLAEALASIQSLSAITQLKVMHATRKPKQWFDLVSEEQREAIPKKEQKRQMQIWELIQGEMEYVADLAVIEDLFVAGLREADVPIIERSRLEIFLDDAFHNYRSLLEVHAVLLDRLQTRQIEQHPQIGSISDLVFDAALNWQEAYMEYVTHYPIAKVRVQEEQTKNPRFAAFLEACLRNPLSNRQDIYHFINRPIPRLLRYNLLLADILKSLREVDPEHPDIDTIPQVMELIADLGRATQKGVAVNEAKVELWTFQHSLDGGKFGSRAVKDLDLLNPMRELIYKGRVVRQPESIGSSWVELLLLLFDNYLVLAKPEKSRRRETMRYVINRRPIPLELLSLGTFGEAPRNRAGRVFGLQHGDDDERLWPFNILFIGQGQLGGQYTLFTDSYAHRAEWQDKLQHAKVLRAEVNDAGKVFEMTPLSLDTFVMPPNYTVEGEFTGQVTCSAPFVTPDGRSLVAIGCEEGVWIGLRGDAKSLRKVLHVKDVTSLAVLEEFGIFLVLQDKSLLAYHLEALVPSAQSPQVRAAPQRLSPGKDIVFFTVGQLSGRTLVLYMKKKGMDSLFRVLEPIMNKDERRRPFGGILGQRQEWSRLYKDFFIPTEALNVHFLKHKLAVVCAKGFEIMDLTDLKGGSIPIFDPTKLRDRPHLVDVQRRCDAARPLGMFRSTETEFFLVYDSFGIYVDRHGEPNRSQEVIEWEGRPDSVAFHPPYLLLVSAQFIEIRHIDTAKLVQIYTGADLRLTWDGTGGMARPFVDNPGPKGYGDEASSQDPRIHISQRPEKGRTRHGIVQHVYELTPTLLLNNPLLNPIHTHDSNYFPPAPMVGAYPGAAGGMYHPTQRPSSISTSHSEWYQWQHQQGQGQGQGYVGGAGGNGLGMMGVGPGGQGMYGGAGGNGHASMGMGTGMGGGMGGTGTPYSYSDREPSWHGHGHGQ